MAWITPHQLQDLRYVFNYTNACPTRRQYSKDSCLIRPEPYRSTSLRYPLYLISSRIDQYTFTALANFGYAQANRCHISTTAEHNPTDKCAGSAGASLYEPGELICLGSWTAEFDCGLDVGNEKWKRTHELRPIGQNI